MVAVLVVFLTGHVTVKETFSTNVEFVEETELLVWDVFMSQLVTTTPKQLLTMAHASFIVLDVQMRVLVIMMLDPCKMMVLVSIMTRVEVVEVQVSLRENVTVTDMYLTQ
jgi:hypothetical protein